ncbi:MAG: hypothetical protein Q4B18_04875, partial [Bacillota bacterium]|nr:hypothetical protein [Bacillota bacterium]
GRGFGHIFRARGQKNKKLIIANKTKGFVGFFICSFQKTTGLATIRENDCSNTISDRKIVVIEGSLLANSKISLKKPPAGQY